MKLKTPHQRWELMSTYGWLGSTSMGCTCDHQGLEG
jgi:hypothetical protein